ncbi:hypothetical protein SELMODRAFT_142654 [Selaginella moellendorffii]|uniref:glutathione transferase n=1 Tax=Selaginella moellendorffii TaxID=88036 RepID=D8R0M0_SELML|nr:glutathione S-transferase F9 [Selaginella moellendorffii]EFJ34604.1 hypothetical protein SELMODRAFT_142654 [Selaginella moellendorffii]|eukprot:XP_002964271.1 glutathione S-transferase F9 [Selaginella moellendorffii]
MAIKIYGIPMSTCTGRVLYTLKEKSLDYELVPVNLATGEHKHPQFLAKQPFGQIPVLENEGLTLFESRAISRYICDLSPKGEPLYGKTPEDRALVEQWLEVESQNFNPPISTIVFQLVFSKFRGLTPDQEVVESNLKKLDSVLAIYESHLASQDYLAGSFFSLADLSHVPYLHYLINVAKKGDVVTSKKNVSAWWEKISSRPAWQEVVAAAAAAP